MYVYILHPIIENNHLAKHLKLPIHHIKDLSKEKLQVPVYG